MRAAPWLAVGILAFAAPPSVAAQLGSPYETPSVEVVQELAFQEEVDPEERGHLQWIVEAGAYEADEEGVFESAIGVELGVVEGLELQGSVPIQVGLDSGATGLGQSSLGLVWAPLTDVLAPERAGLSLFLDNSFPARSGVGEAELEHDVSVIAHYAIDRVHAQLSGGVELQHGRELREERQQSVRIDPQAALAIWVHLDTVAIALEGAAEPLAGRFAWNVGPTLLWNPARDVVLTAHGNASFGSGRALYGGTLAAIVRTELFR